MKTIFNSFSILGATNLESRNMEQNVVCKPRRIVAITASVALLGTLVHAQCAFAAAHAAPAKGYSPSLQDGGGKIAAPALQDGGGRVTAAPALQDGGGRVTAAPALQDGGGKVGAAPALQDGGG